MVAKPDHFAVRPPLATTAAKCYIARALNHSPAGFDVITVPDFTAPGGAPLFEARLLFFLASWLQNVAPSNAISLHLACIGEPTASVRWLADRCGASIHICTPWDLTSSRTANKLRGLEIPGQHARVLLADTDLLVLGGIEALAAEIQDGIAAAPAGSKWVPEAIWVRIYERLGLPLPTERTPTLPVEYGLRRPSQTLIREFGRTTDLNRSLPYYNSGVVLADRDCGLREVWTDHLVRFAEIFAPVGTGRADACPHGRENSFFGKMRHAARRTWQRLTTRRVKYPRAVTTCDQAAFTSAVQALRARGVPFYRLPDRYHARRMHCEAGRLRFGEIKIFHATGFLRLPKGERWSLDRALEAGIRQWQQSFRAGGRFRHTDEAEEDARKAGEFLRRLHEEYVQPALAAGNAAR